MSILAFSLLREDSLQDAMFQRCMDLNSLIQNYQKKNQSSNQELLRQVLPLVARRTSISEWDPQLSRRFLVVSYVLAREDMLHHRNDGPEPIELAQQRADWLCSLAAAVGDRVDERVKSQICGFWATSRLATGELEDGPSYLAAILSALEPIRLPESLLEHQAKAQFVIYAAKNRKPEADLGIAKQWCRELLLIPDFRNLIARFAAALEVEIPNLPELSTVQQNVETEVEHAATNQQGQGEQFQEPKVWPTPETISPQSLADEYRKCWMQFTVLAYENASLFAKELLAKLGELTAEYLPEKAGPVLFSAASSLWYSYSVTGKSTLLEGAASAALLLFSTHSTSALAGAQGRQDISRFRSEALHLWMKTQLPRLIKVADLDILLEDAKALNIFLRSRPGDLSLKEGIIEAHAGEYHRSLEENEVEAVALLIRDNAPALRRIHDEYKSRAGVNARIEEQNAWEFLFPESENLADSQPPLKSGNEPGIPITTFRLDPDFQAAIRSGSHEGVYEFARRRLKDLVTLLQRRLDVQLSPENIMEPEGELFISNATRRNQVMPKFIAAKKALKEKDYGRAKSILASLANQLQDRAFEICRNFLAYALARQGNHLTARTYLADLVHSNFPYASTYWNLACLFPPEIEQMSQRLEVLEAGISRAPHIKTLHAAIYLSLLLVESELESGKSSEEIMQGGEILGSDSQQAISHLRERLRFTPLLEAQLLSYYLDFDAMDFFARDRALVRMNWYVENGEPVVPDPGSDPHLSGRRAEAFREAVGRFLDFCVTQQQPEAFDFWLRCRHQVARHRYEYWDIKVTFLERMERRDEAARAFKDEIRLRLGFLRALRELPVLQSPFGSFLFRFFIPQTKQRASKWLLYYNDRAELRGIGHEIFGWLKGFELEYPQFKGKLLPQDRQIQKIYRSDGDQSSGEDVSKLPEIVQGGIKAPPTTPTPGGQQPPRLDLGTVLAEVGAECSASLREVGHILHVQRHLERLLDSLRASDLIESAEALAALLNAWGKTKKSASLEERLKVLGQAQAGVAVLKGAMERQLAPTQWRMTSQLLSAFERVNMNLARTLELLPELAVEPIDLEVLGIDDRAEKTAFAVRVTSRDGGASVRLTKAIATLTDDETEFALRDKLNEIAADVSPEHGAILTFEVAPYNRVRKDSTVRVEVWYEYAGEEYAAKHEVLPLTVRPCPELPESSPYIHGRALQPSEIEGHFFGRGPQQEAILRSVAGGQQRPRYIEGIRRAGKSSLLHSIEYEVERRSLSLIPIYLTAANLASSDHAGVILHNILDGIAKNARLAAWGMTAPAEDRCKTNPAGAYSAFVESLASRLDGLNVFVLLDEFQKLVELGAENTSLGPGIRNLMDMLWGMADPKAKVVWVFAGQRAQRQFKSLLPGALLWGTLQALPVDFLDEEAVSKIIRTPLLGTAVRVPQETVARVYRHTGGHPEVVQQLSEEMLTIIKEERRTILTPADADEAARDLAGYSDNFAATWYPIGELTSEQKQFMEAYVNAVKVGERIAPFKLVSGNQLSPSHKAAIEDLVARKILESFDDGTVGIKAYVLDLWLHRPEIGAGGGIEVHGSIAIFIDVANLTGGTGSAWLSNLDTEKGDEGIPGRFRLATVIDVIESYAGSISPAPIAARWVVNYPLKAPAVMECSSRKYYVEHIPPELFKKGGGQDDVTLREKMLEVEQWFPAVNHFVLVTGDKDYELAINRLLSNGKFVHVVSRRRSLSSSYEMLAEKFPKRFSVVKLEELLEQSVGAST